jgi:RNA polymerase sigma-70 factor (ECF subfamily)
MPAATSPSQETERALLDAARGGDRRALGTLLARYEGPIYRFGTALCRDPEKAKDVLQETLLAMARGLPEYRGDASLSTWLFTIARSFCIKQQRSRKHAPELVSLDGDGDTAAPETAALGPLPDDALAQQRIARAVQQAIFTLPPDQREVLILRDVEGLSASEVAAVLALSVPAVKSRLHRARLAVRGALAPLVGAPEETPAPATCPDLLAALSQHLEGDLDAKACAAMEHHLEGCSRCRGACDSLKRTLALCQTAPRTEVPPAIRDAVRVALRDFLLSP